MWSKLINTLRNKISSKKYPICRIEAVDLEKNVIVLHCRGTNSSIRLGLEELIYDTAILANLSPKHAAWIGYYAGKTHSIKRKKQKDDFSIQPTKGKYNIMMLDRHGQILYSKPNNDAMVSISPELAVRNNQLINQFGPIQACYIGLLAGI